MVAEGATRTCRTGVTLDAPVHELLEVVLRADARHLLQLRNKVHTRVDLEQPLRNLDIDESALLITVISHWWSPPS